MNSIKLFDSKQIRAVWNKVDQKWYFSMSDVVEVLTDSTNVRGYIKKMRKREHRWMPSGGQFVPPLFAFLLETTSSRFRSHPRARD
jgi:hypothetical protein